MKDEYKILTIDLKEKSYTLDTIDKNIAKSYMGGLGLAYYYLDKNKFIESLWMIFTSAIIKFNNPISKYEILAKDNLGEISYASMGGNFSYFLKTNAYDAIILINKSYQLVDILIGGDRILFNEVSDKSSFFNSDSLAYFRDLYGEDISSLYITKSAIREDKLARLIEDKYRGTSHGLEKLLFDKNVRSISVKKNNKSVLGLPKIYEKNPNRICKTCPLGCYFKKANKKSSIFDKKGSYTDYENKLLQKIVNNLDEYGIDLFSLSDSIKFAYKYLNDIYNFKDLSLENLYDISLKITADNREIIYRDLANGVSFLKEKYDIKDFKDKKKFKNFNQYMDIIDSAGLCLFATDPKDLSKIVLTINKLSSYKYKEQELEALNKKIQNLKNSLD